MAKTRHSPQEVLRWAQKQSRSFTSQDLVQQFGMSRQTASRILSSLVSQNLLAKTGSTLTARYHKPKKGETPKYPLQLKLRKKLKKLQEDEVFKTAALKLNLQKKLPENVYRIAYYAFCEMLNNAIDHSNSKEATIRAQIGHDGFEFWIRDEGFGVFHRIQVGHHLKSEEEAVEHLLKGKQTTAPDAHSGQGIFFTSKIADFFQLRSRALILTFDNLASDIRFGEARPITGTEVHFRIKSHSKKKLQQLFEDFSDDNFEFDRTKYPIIVLEQNGAISRSQARRLTVGLDRFSKIILDFNKVKELGQGFSDEVFRVFQNQHPRIVIEVKNANSAVNFMIRRAQKA